MLYSESSISQESIPVKLVWQRMEDGNVYLAWEVAIYEPSGQNYWITRVDAGNGNILDHNNLVVHCNFNHPQSSACKGHFPESEEIKLDESLSAASSQYRVFKEPIESPIHGSRTLVSDPADPVASPFGWHDTDGNPGAEYTITRGNNVHAYTDTDFNNLPDTDSSPDGGASLIFDFPLDLTMPASTYRPAAVTNLFYWNNYLHDFAYQYGFDELNGNFQVNNYGNGGLGNDHVLAEAQDGSGINNANFATPSDGNSPRMQMFLWYSSNDSVILNSPAPPMVYESGSAAFGPTTFNVTGDLELVDDNVDVTTDACEPLVGFTAGKIAMIDRRVCTFTSKVKKAQDEGAIAVIICNNVSGPPITMGGSDPSITIPSLMLSMEDCDAIKIKMSTNTVNITMIRGGGEHDSDFDNGIIAHEYAHGISNRLTGGPGTVSCLFNSEQMGEGWSDFYALMTTWTGSASNRGVGTYVLGQATSGNGIRPTRYSTDMSINPSTYNTIKTSAIPHGVGYVWCTMLWELVDGLVNAHGETSGFDKAMNIVNLGMAIQVCSPGFVDGRNAILEADELLYNNENFCTIWNAFAKRGLGVSATQGSSYSVGDGQEAFDIPCNCIPTPPTISCPNDVIQSTDPGQCKANLSLEATATDCAGNNPEITYQNLPSGGMYPKGITTVTATATDIAGNTDQCSFTVEINDNEAPMLTCPTDKTVTTATNQCTAVVSLGSPTVSDNCDVPTTSNNGLAQYPLGVTMVTWTSTDMSGNSKICTQKVTVNAATCGIPTQVFHFDTFATTAKVKWKPGKCAVVYELRHRREISPGVWSSYSAWNSATGPGNEHHFTGLIPGSFYHYQIRTNCFSKNSATINGWFHTLSSFSETSDRGEEITEYEFSLPTHIAMVPNPARDYTNVLIQGFENSEKEMTMMDLYGKLIFRARLLPEDNNLELDLERLGVHTGVYLIRVSDGHKQKTNQLMIER